MKRILIAIASLTFPFSVTSVAPLGGQALPDISGQRAKITQGQSTGPRRAIEGLVVRVDDLGVEIEVLDSGATGGTVWVPRDSILSFAVSRQRHWAKEYGIAGALLGGAAGAIIGYNFKTAGTKCSEKLGLFLFIPVITEECKWETGSRADDGFSGGALLGAVVGVVLGRRDSSTTWEVVWGDRRAEHHVLQITPVAGSQMGLSFNFPTR